MEENKNIDSLKSLNHTSNAIIDNNGTLPDPITRLIH